MDMKKYIDDHKQLFIEVNDKIWDYAETRFEEYQSAELLCAELEKAGFTVTKGVANMPTAFVGEFGHGKPVIGILGEYDALSGLSQEGGVSEYKPLVSGEPGHGCGHNSLGTGALAAVMAVREYLIAEGLSGTIRYYGCPGEEGGSGKAYMARAGLFDDVDAALTWHPGGQNSVWTTSSLANFQVYYRFHGRAAHAAGAPHLGRSALDAVELMNVGVNFLREHVIPEARMHYAILNSGGSAPNVVQAEAEVLYLMRAPQLDYVRDMYERINDIAKGAALMTGTTLEIVFDKGCSNYIPNGVLGDVLYDKLQEVVADVEYTAEEQTYAQEISKTFPKAASPFATLKPLVDEEGRKLLNYLETQHICDKVVPYVKIDKAMPGSTDVGDVSWVTPTAQFSGVGCAIGTPGHSWQYVAQNNTGIAHKGVLIAGKTLALAAVEIMKNPELITKAQEELIEKLDGRTYICPIPEGVEPAIRRN